MIFQEKLSAKLRGEGAEACRRLREEGPKGIGVRGIVNFFVGRFAQDDNVKQ